MPRRRQRPGGTARGRKLRTFVRVDRRKTQVGKSKLRSLCNRLFVESRRLSTLSVRRGGLRLRIQVERLQLGGSLV